MCYNICNCEKKAMMKFSKQQIRHKESRSHRAESFCGKSVAEPSFRSCVGEVG